MDGPAGRERTALDRLVERVLDLLAPLGVNTMRLRWRWNHYRDRMDERRRDAANRMRAVTGKHRMCPHCRALVPAGSSRCSECGESLAGASRPGASRLVGWALPGIPPACAAILTVNFLLFVVIAAKAGFTSGGGLFGILSFGEDTLVRYGSGATFVLVTQGLGPFLAHEWWRLVCPVFLHGGLLHLVFNTFVFVQIGPFMEGEYGRDKFFALYLWCGVFSFVASEILRFWMGGGYTNTIGSSGAILGLVGAALVYGYRRGGAFGQQLRGLMMKWVVYFAIMTFVIPGVDAWAHFGGLAAGAAFAGVTAPASPRGASTILWRIAAVAGLLISVAALLLAGLEGQASLDHLRALRGR